MQEHDRGINIYHKGHHTLHGNFPFTHIKKVNERDRLYFGNLKKVIRLMKNAVADMSDDKRKIAKKLSSYDLAAIGYHMDNRLDRPSYMSLGLVEVTRAYLRKLIDDKDYRSSLIVPDDTRDVFDNDEKVDALEVIEKEVDELAKSIFDDLRSSESFFNPSYDSRVLMEKSIYGA